MSGIEWTIAVDDATTSAVYDAADDGPDAAVFVCAHGAGGNFQDSGVRAVSRAMRANGIGVVRFNFLYRERKSSRPDQMPKLTATVEAVVARVREELAPETLVMGGRSMGGRAASMLAADGFAADGLLLLAYPLHPPGQPEKLRDAHLPRITMPVICFSGTRDPFCTPALMDAAVSNVRTQWDMQWIDGADHGFHVLKSSGRTDAEVMAGIGRASRTWVDALRTASHHRGT